MNLEKAVLSLKEHIIFHRRELHKYPEVGFQVEKTRDYILQQLRNWSFDEIKVFADTGIRALIKGKDPERTIGFRADMDALSLKEETGLEFASRNEGFMHACGHDGHMAILLGLAQWLCMHKDRLKDNVVLIFQPAEESVGGALPMIKEGVLNEPEIDVIFGLHIFPDIPQGKIGLSSGAIMAQTCEFDVKITGRAAHGAMPHRGIDALMAACNFITSIQGILTRRINPLKSAVITIGKMEAGERRNILAEKVKMEGTMRTFNEEVYQSIKREILGLLEGMEKSFGVKGEYEELVYYPVVFNDPSLTEKVASLLPKQELIEMQPLMISEDFSYYQQRVPGVYFFLGSGNEKEGFTSPLHSSNFNFDEKILLHGVQVYVNILRGFSCFL